MSYERPNERWACGHAADGKSCRIGPSLRGKCQATFECQPVKDGNRWRCTRTKGEGGPCAEGPLPDGSCCRSIPRCVPVRTLRAKRGLVTRWVCAITIGGLLLAFYGQSRWSFITPGTVSMQHGSAAFTEAAKKAGFDANNCVACHSAGRGGPVSWMRAAFAADPGPLEIHKLVVSADSRMTQIDHACLRCHTGHDFHQPNVVAGYSCSACHTEHNGGQPIAEPDNGHCLSCHGDAHVMQASFERGKTLSLNRPQPAVFRSFANHPDFHPPADLNTLKFNHQKHLTGDIPLLNGRKLDCADCHKPDATGTYMQPMTFEANCRSCHALQFDERNPDLELPHGNVTAVRSYLRSLPTHYADLAAKRKLPTEEFATEQMLRLRERVRAGEDLEQRLFHHAQPRGFPGCALCHEVKSVTDVTPPAIPARWFDQGRFDHSKHRTVSCERCHEVRQSKDTGDVLLPAKATCVTCHSPAGGVADSCAMCHGYHNSPAGQMRAAKDRW